MGIVLDGDALSEAQMQAIAKQAGFSECAFVCRSDKADLRLRFFMPLQETGLCGHATVASICALMEQDARWRGKSELLVETASGVLPIRYRAETNEVMMMQAPAQFAPFGGDREAQMHGRHFSSAFAGTTEDPVTGTASGVMGAYALRYLQPDAAAVDLVVEQGQEIGKDGIVGVHAARKGEIIAVQISGTAVKTKETMWNLED